MWGEVARWLIARLLVPADLVGWLTVVTISEAVTTLALLTTMIVLTRRRDHELRTMRADIEQLKAEAQRGRRERLRLTRKLTTIEEVLQVVLTELKDLKQGDNMRNIFRQEAALLLHPVVAPAQQVTIAGGDRSAAIGRDVRHSPIITGDDNEMDP